MSRLERLHFVSPYSYFVGLRIDAFIADMFHGVAVGRAGDRSDFVETSVLGDERKGPLNITRSVSYLPAITSPVGFVVNEEVREQLNGIPRIHFAPVEFVRLVEFAFGPGAFGYREQFGRHRALASENLAYNLMSRLPVVTGMQAQVGAFFELVCAHSNLFSDAGELLPMQFRRGPRDEDEIIDLLVPRSALEEHAVFHVPYALAIRDSVFKRIEQYFDWNFYYHAEGRISTPSS